MSGRNTGRVSGRGAGSRRARGVRTHGGGRIRGLDEDQPEVSTMFSTGFIEEDQSVRALSFGTPLETPLHVKRRRLYTQSPRIPDASTPVPSTSREALASTSREALLDLNIGEVVDPVAEEPVPSPAAYETCGGSGANTPKSAPKPFHPRRPLRDIEILEALNYGSEDDYDSEEEDVEKLWSRADRDALNEDEEDLPPFMVNLPHVLHPDAADEVEADRVATLSASTSSAATSSAVTSFAATPSSAATTSSAATSSAAGSSLVKPVDLFDFEWKTPSFSAVPPTDRREVFSDINCGPTAPFLTPYDAFIAIWNQDIMEYIAAQTNLYAQEVVAKQLHEGTLGPNSRITHWHDTGANELYVYFGFILATGICVKTDLKEYWVKDSFVATQNLAQYMSYNRFMLLSKCLHFAPNSTDISSLSPPQAKLFKIEPIITHLNSRFQSLYRLNRNIALDESLTQWKGWLQITQFIKNKAASVGIKTYEVCESQSGYLWRFKVYAGREEGAEREVTPVTGVIPSLVLEVLKGLEYKGHTVWMDNHYNSPALARVLKSLGFDCVGTLRTNRQFVPRHLMNLTKPMMANGEVVSCTSGDVDIVVWRDQNRVALLSTYHGTAVHTAGGKTKPIAIHDYNVCMGEVDKKDQILSMFPIERKRTNVWYKKFFRRLLNVSVLNALILYRNSPNSALNIKSHRSFRHDLINTLFLRHFNRPSLASGSETRMGVGRSKVLNVPVIPADILKHFPKRYEQLDGDDKRIRHYCVVCRKRVSSYCPECNVPLCAFECIKSYHSR